jgi:hypothetical protein
MEQPAVPTFERLVDASIESLFRYYLEHEPAGTKEEFTTKFLAPAADSKGRIVQVIRQILEEIQASGKPADLRFGTMWLALGHFAQAMNAYHGRQQETGYILFSVGRYWEGVTWASRGIERARAATVAFAGEQAISDRNRDAAQSKNRQLREEAYRLARDLKGGKMWPSRNNAAGTIAKELRAFAKKLGLPPLTESEERKTVDRWLAAMPDRAVLFKQKSKRSS